QNGAYEKADQAFAAAMGKPLDLQQEERFRSRRVFARYKGGKGLSAYNDIPPRKKTFDQLAWLYSGDRNAKGLLTLIEAHRRVEPKDQDLPAWDLEARWLAEEYEKVVKLATANRAPFLSSPAHRWKVVDRLIRSLVRLKRFKEAIKEAEEVVDAKTNPNLPVLVYAASGDGEKTTKAMEEA